MDDVFTVDGDGHTNLIPTEGEIVSEPTPEPAAPEPAAEPATEPDAEQEAEGPPVLVDEDYLPDALELSQRPRVQDHGETPPPIVVGRYTEFLAAAAGYLATGTAWFIDASHWQGWLDVGRFAGLGCAGIIAKAVEGQSGYDQSFVHTAQGTHHFGILGGGYGFGHPGWSSGSSQAKTLAHLCDSEGMTAAALDFEVLDGVGRSYARSWADDYMGTLAVEHKGALIGYMSQSYAQEFGDVVFKEREGRKVGRWIASPGSTPYVGFDAWQSNWYGNIAGVHPLDVNTWLGDLASLKRWFGAEAAPAPVPVATPVVPIHVNPPAPKPVPVTPPAPPAPPATKGTAMLITVDGSVFSWNFGGGRDSIMQHTNPDRIADLEKHGMRHVRPGDPAHQLFAPVITAILAKPVA